MSLEKIVEKKFTAPIPGFLDPLIVIGTYLFVADNAPELIKDH
jgi:hypothetical protein